MDHRIIGTTLPVLEMTLHPGEKLIAQAGELSWISAPIELHTSTQLAGAKGLFGVIKRAVVDHIAALIRRANTEMVPMSGKNNVLVS